MQLQEQHFPNPLIWKRTCCNYNYNYSNDLLNLLLFHSFLSAGCLVFLPVLRVLSGWLNFTLSLTLCTADFLFLSYSAPCWTVTVSKHLLRFSQQQVFILFSSFFHSWWISGIVPSLCHLRTYDVLWCAIVLQCIDGVAGYCFTWSGCAFVFECNDLKYILILLISYFNGVCDYTL